MKIIESRGHRRGGKEHDCMTIVVALWILLCSGYNNGSFWALSTIWHNLKHRKVRRKCDPGQKSGFVHQTTKSKCPKGPKAPLGQNRALKPSWRTAAHSNYVVK
eukprot:1138706-Pelagomonas_calceolata.AAC.3